jgi:DNA-binding CsgD family transcriptional regulator
MGGDAPWIPFAVGLTAPELRLLPLLAEPQLSLREISTILDLPRDVVIALSRSLYRKLDVDGDTPPHLHRL